MSTVNEKMTAIADAIRDKTGGTEVLTLDDMAENIPNVYEAGRQSQYDEFWNAFQDDGARTDYRNAFFMWDEDTYNPKYVVKPTTAEKMFYNSPIQDIYKNGIVTIDFSNCAVLTDCFRFCSVKSLGIINLKRLTSTASSAVFAYCPNLHTIEKLILKEDGSITFASWFTSVTKLENITIEGKIGKAISFQWASLLTYDSLISIKNALLDVSETGTTRTITLHANAKAKLTESDIAEITQKGWTIV